MTMLYYDERGRVRGEIRVTCGGKPLEGPYLPPASALAELGRFLASRYSAKDAQLPRASDSNREDI